MKSKASYVSGFDLLQQYMYQKPDVLAREVISAMHAGGVVWRMPPGSGEVNDTNARWSNLDFLGRGKARWAWEAQWPQEDNRFSWDAVGKVQIGKVGWEWLLLTAFAHPEELEQSLEPSINPADERIASVIGAAKRRYEVEPGIDWIHSNSYITTRLSMLSFLREYGLCVRMLFIYFYAEETKKEHLYPSLNEWESAITTAERKLGLTGKSVLERRIYRTFLPAIGL